MDEVDGARVAVFGLGYVGLPLAHACTNAGYRVVGFDIDENRNLELMSAQSPIEDVSNEQVAAMIRRGFFATEDVLELTEIDVYVICVPTPLSSSGAPDLSAVESVSHMISERLEFSNAPLVILESTTYPGTTSEVVLPILEKFGLKGGKDFNLAFSPERIDPGNTTWTLENTPKIVGGLTDACASKALQFYSRLTSQVVPTKGLMEAEMAKLLENTYRHINIALVNELWELCSELEIDMWDVIRAAETKPYGFQAFRPGPGVGGHCIPVDPNYLSHRVRSKLGRPFRLVELAQEVNSSMPEFVVRQAHEKLNALGRPFNKSQVLLLGVSYKPNVSDTRESPAIPIARLLRRYGCNVAYIDPGVSLFAVDGVALPRISEIDFDESAWDLIILLQEHQEFEGISKNLEPERFLNTRGSR